MDHLDSYNSSQVSTKFQILFCVLFKSWFSEGQFKEGLILTQTKKKKKHLQGHDFSVMNRLMNRPFSDENM